MTIKEFKETLYKKGMKAVYMTVVYEIKGVNLEEHLFQLGEPESEDEDSIWVRCENVVLYPEL